MERFKPADNVIVNLSLTPEAAHILDQYCSQRTKGRFVSELLVELRRQDEIIARQAAVQAQLGKKSRQAQPKKRR